MPANESPKEFVADANHAILNNDGKAWLAYKSKREQAFLIHRLQKQVSQLLLRVKRLEERQNETASNS